MFARAKGLLLLFLLVCQFSIATEDDCAKRTLALGRPIVPNEVTAARTDTLPPEVFDAVNELIVENWDGRSATVKQEELGKLIAKKLDIPVAQVYARKYLDVEPSFRAVGWKVVYDKPGFNESGEAYFRFSRE